MTGTFSSSLRGGAADDAISPGPVIARRHRRGDFLTPAGDFRDCFAALATTGTFSSSLRGGVADEAISPGPVIARSAATRRSPGNCPRFERLLRCGRNDPSLSAVKKRLLRCARNDRNFSTVIARRRRRGDFLTPAGDFRDCFAALATTGTFSSSLRGGAADDAISPGPVIARSAATRRSPCNCRRFQRLLRCARNDPSLSAVKGRLLRCARND
jgi:hypothetical protein